MTIKNVIYDADMGGDDLWAMAMLAHYHRQNDINILGISSCFGNVNLEQATKNILNFLSYIKMDDMPVYKGCSAPINNTPPLLDGAFGSDGLSLASIPHSDIKPQDKDAISWISEALEAATKPITIICTGPITNIATVFQNNPELDAKGHEIIWFGGSLCPAGGGHVPVMEDDGEYRIGNITRYAEFNVINDPVAAQIIADLKHTKVTYVPMDATQHMDIGLSYITGFLGAMDKVGLNDFARCLTLMLHDVAGLDETKFKAKGCYIHDAQVIQYMMNPDLFLPAVPIQNIQFMNDNEKAMAFNAIESGFNFSLLGHHGQMSCEKAEHSNHYFVPGLTSFQSPENITKNDIHSMQKMSDSRWEHLSNIMSHSKI